LRYRRLIVAAATGACLLVPSTAVAAEPPENPNGWGTVVSQFATVLPPSGFGDHASGFSTPRDGIGNVSKDPNQNDLDNGHPGGHGCFAANMDPFAATDCNGSPGNAD
jgi:hypothetical protein